MPLNLREMPINQLAILWNASSGNPSVRQAVTEEFSRRIPQNQSCSKEYIFNVARVRNHAITIKFIPSSSSYQTYGGSITINTHESETEGLLRNLTARPPVSTYGRLRAIPLVHDQLDAGQVATLARDGFDTHDILEVLHI